MNNFAGKMVNYSFLNIIGKFTHMMRSELFYIPWICRTPIMFMLLVLSIYPAIYFRNDVQVKRRMFYAYVPKTNNQWIYLVLNFIGPNGGEGIQAFKDGSLSTSHEQFWTIHGEGDGRVVVGRRYSHRNSHYAHVEMDELIFFNQTLLENDVSNLYSIYQ